MSRSAGLPQAARRMSGSTADPGSGMPVARKHAAPRDRSCLSSASRTSRPSLMSRKLSLSANMPAAITIHDSPAPAELGSGNCFMQLWNLTARRREKLLLAWMNRPFDAPRKRCRKTGSTRNKDLNATMVAESTSSKPDNPFPRVTAAQWDAAASKSPNRDRARAVLLPSRVELDRSRHGAASRMHRRRFHQDTGFRHRIRDNLRRRPRGGAAGIAVAFAGSPHPLAGTSSNRRGGKDSLRPRSAIPLAKFASAAATTARWPIFWRLRQAMTSPSRWTSTRSPRRRSTVARVRTRLHATSKRPGPAWPARMRDHRRWPALACRAGATDAQELAAVLATFVAYLRRAPRADRISLALAADSDQFETIAKFRAMRLLALRVMQAARSCGTRYRGSTRKPRGVRSAHASRR